ncbi:MAG TPA: hypothetical protein VGB64_01610 [Actinomycetota bacterium]
MNRSPSPAANGTVSLSVGTLAMLIALVAVGTRAVDTDPWLAPMLDAPSRAVSGPRIARPAVGAELNDVLRPAATQVLSIAQASTGAVAGVVSVVIPSEIGTPGSPAPAGGTWRPQPKPEADPVVLGTGGGGSTGTGGGSTGGVSGGSGAVDSPSTGDDETEPDGEANKPGKKKDDDTGDDTGDDAGDDPKQDGGKGKKNEGNGNDDNDKKKQGGGGRRR